MISRWWFLLTLLFASCSSIYTATQPESIKGRFYQVSSKLSKISNLPPYKWQYKLIDSHAPILSWHRDEKIVTIALSKGLAEEAQSDDELALMIAQAMAHVSLNHPNAADFRTYHDLKVREADRLGMAYASKAIYYPRPAKAMWIRLRDKYGSKPYVGFSWNKGREETYTWNIEPILRLYNGRKNNTVY